MAVFRAEEIYTGLSTETKPTPVSDGALFMEHDTGLWYHRRDGAWTMMAPGIEGWDWWNVTFSDLGQVNIAGSGATTALDRFVQVTTGATASSTAGRQTASSSAQGLSRGRAGGVLDWDKNVVMFLKLHTQNQTALGVFRVMFGAPAAGGGIGQPAARSIGIEIGNAALEGLHHDGTNVSNDDLATALTNTQVYTIKVVSKAGTVRYYVDGTAVGSAYTDGPAGLSAADDMGLTIAALNGDPGADARLRVNRILIGVQQ